MPLQKVREFLNDQGVKYVTIKHSPAFTAQEIAGSARVPGKELAKTVMIRIEGKMAMAVLPATERVDFELLKCIVQTTDVQLAEEYEFKNLFPGCEIGAMPPFGNLYDMEVYVEKSLAEDKEISFNAGSHTEFFRMSYQDFKRLLKPKLARFSTANY
jgi:Ala-tRNA(Pro) deacylase